MESDGRDGVQACLARTCEILRVNVHSANAAVRLLTRKLGPDLQPRSPVPRRNRVMEQFMPKAKPKPREQVGGSAASEHVTRQGESAFRTAPFILARNAIMNLRAGPAKTWKAPLQHRRLVGLPPAWDD